MDGKYSCILGYTVCKLTSSVLIIYHCNTLIVKNERNTVLNYLLLKVVYLIRLRIFNRMFCTVSPYVKVVSCQSRNLSCKESLVFQAGFP